jgi:LAO/AO transport system kinase
MQQLITLHANILLLGVVKNHKLEFMSSTENQNQSALHVNQGVEQPDAVNLSAVDRFRQMRRRKLTPEDYYQGIISGNRTLLGRAITLIESVHPDHHYAAQEIIKMCLPRSGNSIRIGITGVPGVGKSTFIEAIGKHITGQGHRLAVLAIDPSSSRTKGSILGDKTRMESLSADENAFIRPSPSAGSLGGVARKTREIIILCEAAGYDIVLVETVGVGQSEIAVHSMVDFFLLLMLAGAGDELQGIKRGIMEMADAIFINKAEGENLKNATRAQSQYKNALHLFPPTDSGWTPRVGICSAITGNGIPQVWDTINEYQNFAKVNGYFDTKRKAQNIEIMIETINEYLKNDFYQNQKIKERFKAISVMVQNDQVSSYIAAQQLIDHYFENIKNRKA